MSYLNRYLVSSFQCLVLAIAFMSLNLNAQSILQDGKNFIRLAAAQPTDQNKIEVLEFFWYNCVHCFAFEPELEVWAKKLPADVVFKRVPVRFRDNFEPQQKAFFSLQLMGVVDSLQQKIFDRIHVQKKPLDTDADLIDYVVSQGVNKTEFVKLFNSFSVVNLARSVTKMQTDFQIDGVPTLVIAGKYRTSPSIAGSTTNALNVADALIAAERGARAGANKKTGHATPEKKVKVVRP